MPHKRKYEGICIRISIDYDRTYPQYQRESTKGMMQKFPIQFMAFPEWLSELINIGALAQAHYDRNMAEYNVSEKEMQRLVKEAEASLTKAMGTKKK